MKVVGLQHVAIAVNELEPFQRLFTEKLGIEMTDVMDREARNVRKAVFGFPDGTHVELIRPTGPGNMTQRWLEEKGETLFHFAIEVEDIDAALEELKERGVALIDKTARPGAYGSRVAFIDPADTENVIIELIERAPS